MQRSISTKFYQLGVDRQLGERKNEFSSSVKDQAYLHDRFLRNVDVEISTPFIQLEIKPEVATFLSF